LNTFSQVETINRCLDSVQGANERGDKIGREKEAGRAQMKCETLIVGQDNTAPLYAAAAKVVRAKLQRLT
jgi:hypothetical protein